MQVELDQLRHENELLRRKVAALNDGASSASTTPEDVAAHRQVLHMWEMGSHGLDSWQITRYSRQILLRSFGSQGA